MPKSKETLIKESVEQLIKEATDTKKWTSRADLVDYFTNKFESLCDPDIIRIFSVSVNPGNDRPVLGYGHDSVGPWTAIVQYKDGAWLKDGNPVEIDYWMTIPKVYAPADSR